MHVHKRAILFSTAVQSIIYFLPKSCLSYLVEKQLRTPEWGIVLQSSAQEGLQVWELCNPWVLLIKLEKRLHLTELKLDSLYIISVNGPRSLNYSCTSLKVICKLALYFQWSV